jgi:hypothetical protein
MPAALTHQIRLIAAIQHGSNREPPMSASGPGRVKTQKLEARRE